MCKRAIESDEKRGALSFWTRWVLRGAWCAKGRGEVREKKRSAPFVAARNYART